MQIRLEEDDFLRIQLLSYSRPTALKERYYFLEMSTLQATKALPKARVIKTISLAADGATPSLDKQTIKSIKTVGQFNAFFMNNSHHYSIGCRIVFDHGLVLSSHDDGEVCVEFLKGKGDEELIHSIFQYYHLDLSLIKILKSKPSYYISIDHGSTITGEFKIFDEYLKHGFRSG